MYDAQTHLIKKGYRLAINRILNLHYCNSGTYRLRTSLELEGCCLVLQGVQQLGISLGAHLRSGPQRERQSLLPP